MMGKLRALLIGTGEWAEVHADAYARCAEVELVAIAGHRDERRLSALGRKAGLGATSLDAEALISKVEPDVVDIACNPHYRLAGVRAAMRPFVGLVNVEKPLALTPGDAREIERLCRQHDKPLTVNHQKKFLPAWRVAKDAIDAGDIGELRSIRGTCQGNMLEQGTHLVDMVLHFNDYNPVRWVMGQVGDLEGLDKPGAPAPDAAVASIAFGNGVRALVEMGTVGRDLPGETFKWHQFGVEAHGTEGRLSVALNTTLAITTFRDGATRAQESSWQKHYLDAQVAHLDTSARYARDPSAGHVSDLDRSIQSFDVAMAILSSAVRGGRVDLPARFDDCLTEKLQALRNGTS